METDAEVAIETRLEFGDQSEVANLAGQRLVGLTPDKRISVTI